MLPLRAADVLGAWEAGRRQPPVERALTLLGFVCPDSSADELARLPLGQRDSLFLQAHAAALGGTLNGLARCPECDESVGVSMDVARMTGRADNAPPLATLQCGEFRLRYRLPDSRDLIAVSVCESPELARATLLARCVSDARRGETPVDAGALPDDVIAALEARISECDPLAETVLDLTCPTCSARWLTELDVAGFFWAELRSLAVRLLQEIDALARAYGWREREILELSPTRRAWYLERVGG